MTPDSIPAGVGRSVAPGAPGASGVSEQAREPIVTDAADVAGVGGMGGVGGADGAVGVAGVAGGPVAAGAADVADPADLDPTAAATAAATADSAGESEPEQEADPLACALAEADELRDRFARLQAEWDNFRKRTAAERVQERIRAAEALVERLLPIVDDLERAIEHSDTANEASLKEGIAAVHSKLTEVLEREGVKTINPVGEAFDANVHQAVGKEDDASVPDETVTKVYQKGYGMGDRVLRTAMVVVSQGGPKREVE
jgi:molecular chaperone GrpE